MGAWDITTPADNALAKIIHTGIQATKVDVIERLRVYNGSNYEHLVFGGSATGRHLISSVGFSEIFTDIFDANTWIAANSPDDGGIFVAGSSLYLTKSLSYVKVTTTDHGELSNISGGDHTQYMDTVGTRAATGNWSITETYQLSESTFGTSASDALSSSHTNGTSGSGWYAAHGANCLWQRHFADNSTYLSVIDYSTSITNYPATLIRYIHFDPTINKYSSFPTNVCLSSGGGQPLVCLYNAGTPSYLYTSSGNINIRYSTINNGVST